MKRSIGLWQLMGFAVSTLGGTILHFLYEWAGEAAWIAPFSGVNESTFEHMKLLFWPTFIFAALESYFFKDYKDFWCVKLRGILLGLLLIPVIFYTYNGVIGHSPDWVNIGIFFVAAAAEYIYETKKLRQGTCICKNPKIPLAILCLIGSLFVIFTFATPHLEIFRDPLSGAYGI